MLTNVIHSTLEIASDPGHWIFEVFSGAIFFGIGSVWHTFWQRGHDHDHHDVDFTTLDSAIARLEADMDAITGASPVSHGPADALFPDGYRHRWLTGAEVPLNEQYGPWKSHTK